MIKYNSFHRVILQEIMPENLLTEMDRAYTKAKIKRLIKRLEEKDKENENENEEENENEMHKLITSDVRKMLDVLMRVSKTKKDL